MNAVNGVNFGFSVQSGDMKYDSTQKLKTSGTQNNQEPNSFLSILNLLDVNADQKIDTQELKFGAGFMINSLIQAKDQDSNLLLSAEEAAVSPGVVSQLDTNSDQQLGAGEMITAANKIIDGLVPVLDTNGDGGLSREELAIFELLFSSSPSAVAEPESVSGSVGQAFDMDKIPDRMRAQGWDGTDNELYFALFTVYSGREWFNPYATPVSTELYNNRDKIYKWYDDYVVSIGEKLKSNPQMKTTVVTNDANDRGGCFLAEPTRNRLIGLGVSENQIQLGEIYSS